MTFIDCTFKQNSALNGGAIFSNGNLSVNGYNFINNSGGNETSGNDGAIQISSNGRFNVNISDSIFINNSARRRSYNDFCWKY